MIWDIFKLNITVSCESMKPDFRHVRNRIISQIACIHHSQVHTCGMILKRLRWTVYLRTLYRLLRRTFTLMNVSYDYETWGCFDSFFPRKMTQFTSVQTIVTIHNLWIITWWYISFDGKFYAEFKFLVQKIFRLRVFEIFEYVKIWADLKNLNRSH